MATQEALTQEATTAPADATSVPGPKHVGPAKDLEELEAICTKLYGRPGRWLAVRGKDEDGAIYDFVFLRSRLNHPSIYDELVIKRAEAKNDPLDMANFYRWCAQAALDPDFGGGNVGFQKVAQETADFPRAAGMLIYGKLNVDLEVVTKN